MPPEKIDELKKRTLLCAPDSPEELVKLINNYNQCLVNANELEQLFYLQKICQLMLEKSTHPKIAEWKYYTGEDGLEAHLQHYHVHRDASVLLMKIEFANAVSQCHTHLQQHMQRDDKNHPSSDATLYEEIRAGNAILKKDLTQENLSDFIRTNMNIMQKYETNNDLKEKVLRHLSFLNHIYAKMESIQGFVQQNFNEYQTKVLGSTEGNNKNFILDIDGEEKRIVIRVENRDTFGGDLLLQTHEVSNYFSEDYAMFLMPFEEGVKPVVFSEMATKGDLFTYSQTSTGDKKNDVEQAQYFFNKLSDFCLKLMDAGYYHPDIKLSNFLTDGERLIVSDRKTLTSTINPTVDQIESTPHYGAPEYLKCLTVDNNGNMTLNRSLAKNTMLNMPAYMSYQLGMALKEFLLNQAGIQADNLANAQLPSELQNSSYALINISELIKELTRDHPEDRLPIKDFHLLMKKINNRPIDFSTELNQLPSVKLYKTRREAQYQVNNFLKYIEEKLQAEDYKKASIWDKFWNKVTLGLTSIPKISTAAQMEAPSAVMKSHIAYVIQAGDLGMQGIKNKTLFKQILEHQELRELKVSSEPKKWNNPMARLFVPPERVEQPAAKKQAEPEEEVEEIDTVSEYLLDKYGEPTEIKNPYYEPPTPKEDKIQVKAVEEPDFMKNINAIPTQRAVDTIPATIARGNKTLETANEPRHASFKPNK